MFWGGILGNEFVGPYRVPYGIKMNAQSSYVQFLKNNFLPWFKKKGRAFKRIMIFMQDNAPSHATLLTKESLPKLGIKEEKIMVCPLLENFWSILKRKIYADGGQYTSKDQLWGAIMSCAREVDPDDITISVDDRLVDVISKKGDYVNK